VADVGFDPAEPRDAKGRWNFKDLAARIQISGGFTHNPRTHEEATKGYAVSIPGHEQKVAGHAPAAAIKAYVRKHKADLADPNAHLGAWSNTDDHNTYLDISHVLTTKQAAEQTAVEHDQLAYFDLNTFEEHRVPGRADREKGMSLSTITPTLNGEYDLSARDGHLAFWKQILPKKTIHYTAKDGSRQTLDFTDQYLRDLASNSAVDKVGFLLADRDNAHTMDPERWRGEVAAMEVREDGLYGKIVFPSVEAARAVLDNPALGVSARIRENIGRSDGSTVARGIVHVLGTLDPQVSGMTPWQPTDLSTSQDEVLDLSEQEYETMAEQKSLTDYTEADIDAMDEDALDEFLAQFVPGFDATLVETEDEHEDAEKGELVGAGADMSNGTGTTDLDLANARADQATAFANEALRRVADAEWREERTGYLGDGVPPAALDLAAPVLNRASDMVIDLSNSGEDDVNVSAVVRGLLDSLKGTVDLSAESGHFGTHSGEDNPDQAILDKWTILG
jgi:hypothetical protein